MTTATEWWDIIGRNGGTAYIESAMREGRCDDLRAKLDEAGDIIMGAWAVIANVGHKQGGWDDQDDEWLSCARKWRDEQFHPFSLAYNLVTNPTTPQPQPAAPHPAADHEARIAALEAEVEKQRDWNDRVANRIADLEAEVGIGLSGLGSRLTPSLSQRVAALEAKP